MISLQGRFGAIPTISSLVKMCISDKKNPTRSVRVGLSSFKAPQRFKVVKRYYGNWICNGDALQQDYPSKIMDTEIGGSEMSNSGVQSKISVRASFQTRANSMIRPNNRDETNYDEMTGLNLDLEGSGGRRSVFPASWRLFKPSAAIIGQQRRREEALERCKQMRYQMTIKSRKMMTAFKKSDQLASMVESSSSMDENTSNHPKDASSAPPKDDVDALFANSLMLPEYLSEIPPEFAIEWHCKPFPAGTRCTVIARGGKTQSRDCDGYLLDEFQSLLPCGSVYNASPNDSHSTILDCVLVDCDCNNDSSAKQLVYFVLDMMAWNGKFYYNSSAESRFWMVNSWIQDIDGIDQVNKAPNRERNDRIFFCLPTLDCDVNGLEMATHSPQAYELSNIIEPGMTENISNFSHSDARLWGNHIEFKPEGVMFYFKDMDYIDAQTPVMCVLPIQAARELLQTLSLTSAPNDMIDQIDAM